VNYLLTEYLRILKTVAEPPAPGSLEPVMEIDGRIAAIAEAEATLTTLHSDLSFGHSHVRIPIHDNLLRVRDDVRAAIASKREILFNVNSPGGNVDVVFELLRLIENKHVEIYCRRAHSAAAVFVALARGHRRISHAGGLKFHRIWSMVAGDDDDFDMAAVMLRALKNYIIDKLAERTEQTVARIGELFQKGKDASLSPQAALAMRLVDSIEPPCDVADSSPPSGEIK
jgi:ATP-dependent protease ClpP protease subunit